MRARGAWSPEEVEVLIDMLDDLEQGWLAAAELYYVVLAEKTSKEQNQQIADVVAAYLREGYRGDSGVLAFPDRNHLSATLEWLAWRFCVPEGTWKRFVVEVNPYEIDKYQAKVLDQNPEAYADFLTWKRDEEP